MKLNPEETNMTEQEMNEAGLNAPAEVGESDLEDNAEGNGAIEPEEPADGAAEDGDAAELDDTPLEMVEQLEYLPVTGKKSKDDDEAGDLQLTTVSEARAVIEGFLFTTNEPLSVQRLSKLMNNLHPRTIRGLLLELQMEYDNRPNALQILEIAGGFQMATRASYADWMFRMHRHKRRSALSPATLETLAIIAYKQPITRGEVEAIRGVDSSGTMRTLQDLNLVDASGRREIIGRPQLFITTDQFLKSFGLRSLADLPSISELRNLFANQQKLQASVAKTPGTEVDQEDAAAGRTGEENQLEDAAGGSAEEASGSDEPGESDEPVAMTAEAENVPNETPDDFGTSVTPRME